MDDAIRLARSRFNSRSLSHCFIRRLFFDSRCLSPGRFPTLLVLRSTPLFPVQILLFLFSALFFLLLISFTGLCCSRGRTLGALQVLTPAILFLLASLFVDQSLLGLSSSFCLLNATLLLTLLFQKLLFFLSLFIEFSLLFFPVALLSQFFHCHATLGCGCCDLVFLLFLLLLGLLLSFLLLCRKQLIQQLLGLDLGLVPQGLHFLHDLTSFLVFASHND